MQTRPARPDRGIRLNDPQDGLPGESASSSSSSSSISSSNSSSNNSSNNSTNNSTNNSSTKITDDGAFKVPVAVPVVDAAPVKNRFGVHPDILKLGLVSFLTDLSSEMIFSVFAVFFTTIAGASSALLGLVEGLADFSASALNYFAGWLSDRSGRRKVFALAGYGFSTLAKIILLVSSSIAGLALFRVIERLGKGFRGPPRDAWLSAIAAQGSRGYAFGVHKALDKSGAVIGPLMAYGLLSWLGETRQGFQVLFLVAFVPAVLSVLVLSRIKDQPGQRFEREKIGASLPGFLRWPISASVFCCCVPTKRVSA